MDTLSSEPERCTDEAPGARRAATVLVGVLIVLAAWMRLYQVGESLWVDELHTAWTVSGSAGEIPGRAAMGNTSPAYFYLPWLAGRLMGMNELAMRLPSVLAGVGLVVLIYLLVARWTRSRCAGLLAAFLATIDWNFLFYGQEARTYAMVQLVGLAHVGLFWHVLEKPSGLARAALVLLGALLFYLHYTASLLIVAEVACYGVLCAWRPWRPAYRWWQLLVDLALTGLVCLPAAGHLAQIAARRANWALFVEQRPASAIVTEMYPLRTYVFLPGAIVLVLGLFGWLALRRPLVRRIDPRLALLAVCWLLVPIGLAWLATDRDIARLFLRTDRGVAHLFLRRYVIVSAAAPIVMGSLLCAACRHRPVRATLAVLVAGIAIYTTGPAWLFWHDGRLVRHSEEDWRGAVQLINDATDHTKTPLLLYSGLIESNALTGKDDDPRLVAYCLLPVTAIYPVDASERELVPMHWSDPVGLSEQQWQFVVNRGGAWILVRGERELAQWLPRALQVGLDRRGAKSRVAFTRPFGEKLHVARISVQR